jgi:hypothetical protein
LGDRAIASLGAGPQERLLRLASRSFVPYARRHGYDLHVYRDQVERSRPAPWSKILILRELVQRYDVVVWLDADTVIVDRRYDIADELREDAFLYLVEHTVRGEVRPNTGVMLLRGGDEALAFLDAVWALDRYVNHRWWENAAVSELLGYSDDPAGRLAVTPWRARTCFIGAEWNWIVDAPVRAARIRHFPGFKVRTREALMLAALAEGRMRSLVSDQRGVDGLPGRT